ncbi:hypothetical protein HOD88_00830 [archaeon]|jgi:hypothetical protein|nr:hypothetical protein [archaeon]
MVKDRKNLAHDRLVDLVSARFLLAGFEVQNETPLPSGRGAVDISGKLGDSQFHAEVKISPTSLNKKKVQKQLERYEAHFGSNADYLLISPGANGEVIVQDSERNFKGGLDSYISRIAA